MSRFSAKPKIISGLRALEGLPYELEFFQGSRALIVMMERHSGAKRRLLKKAFSGASLDIGALCCLDDPVDLSQIEEILTALESGGCDCIIALGSGAVQSAAKLANSLYSCRLNTRQLGHLPCRHSTLLPLAAVLTEQTDGREIGSSLEVGSFRLCHETLLPRIAVIDPRMLGRVSEAEAAASALISYTQVCETIAAAGNSPLISGWITPALRLLGAWAGALEEASSRFALVNAAVYAQMIYEIDHPGPVWRLSEIAGDAGISSRSEAAGALIPHYITMLQASSAGVIQNLFSHLGRFASQEPAQSLWRESARGQERQMLLDIAQTLSFRSKGTQRHAVIETLLLRIGMLTDAGERHEAAGLIKAVTSSRSGTEGGRS